MSKLVSVIVGSRVKSAKADGFFPDCEGTVEKIERPNGIPYHFIQWDNGIYAGAFTGEVEVIGFKENDDFATRVWD